MKTTTASITKVTPPVEPRYTLTIEDLNLSDLKFLKALAGNVLCPTAPSPRSATDKIYLAISKIVPHPCYNTAAPVIAPSYETYESYARDADVPEVKEGTIRV